MQSETSSTKESSFLTSVRERIVSTDQKLALSKRALGEWVRQQNLQMDLIEEGLKNECEAIEVEEIDVDSVRLTSVIDEKSMESLMSQADALITESMAETK